MSDGLRVAPGQGWQALAGVEVAVNAGDHFGVIRVRRNGIARFALFSPVDLTQPPFGRWISTSCDDLEVTAMAGDPLGTIHVRRKR